MMGPVYVITDPTAGPSIADQARAAARGGAWAVQIRDKHASDEDMVGLVALLLPEMVAMNVCLIVNDRVDLAIRTGVHGLHIGQGDGCPLEVRRRIGARMILGLSLETEAQARRLQPCVDYVGAGPVRATPTKPDHAAPIGMAGLSRIVAAVTVPVYAIGGLVVGDVATVKGAGATGMAVVSAVVRAANPVSATRTLLADWNAA
jgi:thiamine-phosphate pyrophosphorylase